MIFPSTHYDFQCTNERAPKPHNIAHQIGHVTKTTQVCQVDTKTCGTYLSGAWAPYPPNDMKQYFLYIVQSILLGDIKNLQIE